MSFVFKDQGYSIIKSVISEEMREFITQYALFDEMQNYAPLDDFVPNAHSKYADPAMETLLLSLQPMMEETTGLSLIPTYSYYRVYRNGNDLIKHKDRNACEISCTVAFDFSYSDSNFEWPIYMNNQRVVLSPGDCVVYRGIDLEHWREPLNHPDPNVWHVQGFFHWVDANGPHVDQAYDQRLGVGHTKYKKEIDKRPIKSYIQYN